MPVRGISKSSGRMIELAELRQKLSSPRTRYRQEAKVAEAVQEILQARGVEGWIVTEIKERTEEKYHQDRRWPTQ